MYCDTIALKDNLGQLVLINLSMKVILNLKYIFVPMALPRRPQICIWLSF